MRNIVRIVILQMLFANGYSQNLILNGDFEDVNICTERIADCAPEAWRRTSSSMINYIQSNENNLTDFVVFDKLSPNTRNYLQSRLGDTLIIGETYRISFDISPDGLAINRIGINFTNTIMLSNSDSLINLIPDVEIIDNRNLIRNRKYRHWLHIEKEFIAKENSVYIQIGSFDSDESRKTRKIRRVTKHNSIIRRYLIDNIRLESIQDLHSQADIDCTKEIIYSQNYRHPIDCLLFTIASTAICHKQKLIDSSPLLNDTILLFGDLLFDFDSYEPSVYMTQEIDSAFNSIQSPIDSIIVIGHTDNIGTKNYNDNLSVKRAKSLSEYISSIQGIAYDQILYLGKGSSYPIASNETDIGRYKNRRVEIIIKYKLATNNE